MQITRIVRRLAVAATGIGAAAAVAATPAAAASSQQTMHSSFDATGAVFTCGQGDITVTGGTVDQVMHSGEDAQGVFHYTGTIHVQGVTGVDAAGNQYTITGALWFGGKALSEDQNLVATDTAHFVIHSADGGIYGKVQVVDHFNLNGSTFTFDIGGCEAPQN